MASQKEYWDQQIKEWSEASYKGKGDNLIERIANLFRGPITKRMEVALEIIGPKAKDKVILDLGCGLGDFCFAVLKYRPKKVIGIDISPVAIREAKKRTERRKLKGKVGFLETDVAKIKKLPDFDLGVGLGFIDYLDKGQMRHLFKLLAGRRFLFSFFEKKLSLLNLLHEFYIKIQRCPGAYKYTREEMRQLAPEGLNLRFLEKEGMFFITNFS